MISPYHPLILLSQHLGLFNRRARKPWMLNLVQYFARDSLPYGYPTINFDLFAFIAKNNNSNKSLDNWYRCRMQKQVKASRLSSPFWLNGTWSFSQVTWAGFEPTTSLGWPWRKARLSSSRDKNILPVYTYVSLVLTMPIFCLRRRRRLTSFRWIRCQIFGTKSVGSTSFDPPTVHQQTVGQS